MALWQRAHPVPVGPAKAASRKFHKPKPPKRRPRPPQPLWLLRRLKRRDAKPFALMARDIDVVRRYCTVGPEEEQALVSAAAPIVLLAADKSEKVPDAVAPGLATLGFMLPTTPLHVLILARTERPVVMTSGNVSEEPQVIDDDAARGIN